MSRCGKHRQGCGTCDDAEQPGNEMPNQFFGTEAGVIMAEMVDRRDENAHHEA
jgi:hypothetical protein